MGKGKKNTKKQKPALSLDPLSLSESQPATSQTSSEPSLKEVKEEESLAGSQEKSKDEPIKDQTPAMPTQEAPSSMTKTTAPKATEPLPAQPQTAESSKVQQEEEGGLGLQKTRKPRKKRGKHPTTESSQSLDSTQQIEPKTSEQADNVPPSTFPSAQSHPPGWPVGPPQSQGHPLGLPVALSQQSSPSQGPPPRWAAAPSQQLPSQGPSMASTPRHQLSQPQGRPPGWPAAPIQQLSQPQGLPPSMTGAPPHQSSQPPSQRGWAAISSQNLTPAQGHPPGQSFNLPQQAFPSTHGPSPGVSQTPPHQLSRPQGYPPGQAGNIPQHGSLPQGQAPEKRAPPPQHGSSSAGTGRGRGAVTSQQQTVMPVSVTPSQAMAFRIPPKIPSTIRSKRTITVLTNYLQMNIRALKLFRYDVTVTPDKPKKMIPKAYLKAKEMCFPKHHMAFDQMKNCYTLKPLPNVKENQRFAVQVQITDNNGKVMNFEVSFKPTGSVDLGTILAYMQNGTSLSPPTEAIQAVDVILRQGTLESYVKAGRQFFKRPSQPIDLGEGLEMWTGLFQSAIFTSQPFINIDVAHKGFPKYQPLLQTIQNDFRLDISKPLDRQRGVEGFLHFIKGLRVIATIGGDKSSSAQRREFICNGLVDSPNRIKFKQADEKGVEKTVTVYDYFTKEKKCSLHYPNLNCMWVGPRDKTIYYPIELLHVSYGQAQNKQLTERQLQTMVREAATPPSDRLRKIHEVTRDMNYSRNAYFKEFGLDIADKFFEVEAKILDPPRLDVGVGRSIEPRRGAWQANKFYKPEALMSWGFIAIECDQRSNIDYSRIQSMIMSIGRSMGMNVSEPRLMNFNVRISDLMNILLNALDQKIMFLFVIVSTRGRDYYHQVKKMAERDVGILTQCMKEMTASRKMNDQTVRNILLKVNSKLMGINQVLDNQSMPVCLKDPGGVMIVGADVTHPSPDQTSVPSIAAVTASIDPRCFQYNITLSIQTPKKEMIVDFENMMVEHLQVYKQHRNSLPKKIFVFRDGVSEGQFGQVMQSELRAVHNAYQRMKGPNQRPEILFLLVQKRHHTRLFTMDKVPQNVEPGTVVDKHIVHARELDFYLVSHQAIKGTARPTRYHAVCNDGGINDHDVQQLTFYLCHLYSRCMRSVSYPTPTYYAHLACMRARSLTHGEKFDNKELERSAKRLRVMDRMLSYSRMFFV